MQREHLETFGLNKKVIKTMLGSRRVSTNKLYSGYLNLWMEFCEKMGFNYLSGTLADGLAFLQELKDDKEIKRQYSALATARSAVSSVLSVNYNNCLLKFGEHPFVKQWMKGVEKEMPPTPKYLDIWDPDTVLKMFKTEDWKIENLSLLKLSKKTVMLLLLCTDNRGQLITSLSLAKMAKKDDMIIFKLDSSDLKQGRRNYVPELIKIKPFVGDKDICPKQHLEEYLRRTQHIRGTETKIFLISRKPYSPVSRDTVSRWTSDVLCSAGIDVNIFSAGSTRAAAGSKADRKGVSMDTILKKGGWSQASTFGRFYNKQVRLNDDDNFSEAVLSLN